MTAPEQTGVVMIEVMANVYISGTLPAKQRPDIPGFSNLKVATGVLFLNMQNFHGLKTKWA